ncbi:MAG: TIGR02452 family protein [Peptococcaceae bacterium]|jgi:uncharacterized protein (TIGR02452 family)|nr:TIGR02452 family protein [Peptococcaceae bacterium]
MSQQSSQQYRSPAHEANALCFEDTARLSRDIPLPKTLYYKEGDAPAIQDLPAYKTRVSVTTERAIEAAGNIGGKVGVLNFASASHPGGGVKWGSFAQEESICRITNLYGALDAAQKRREFYNTHKDTRYTDAILYSEAVTVLKTDSKTPVTLEKYWTVNVLTCAAPNQRGLSLSDGDAYKLFRQRVNAILRVFAARGDTKLVLGAFGCGAFRNPPDVVARAFRDEISENYPTAFETIVFAVFTRDPGKDANYQAFRRVLGLGL